MGGGVISWLKRGYVFYQALKTLDKFSSDYLPSCYYFTTIESALNPKKNKFILAHKSIAPLLYAGIVKLPYSVIRTFNGVYFDHSDRAISPERASEILRRESQRLLFKPGSLTVQGMGITVLEGESISELADKIQRGTPVSQYSDFVIQRFVGQSPDTQIFNSSSLNTMRVTTLNLNGEISICSRALKCGPLNSVVDNIGIGKKGVAVGINEDGSFSRYGFYGNGETTIAHNGTIFDGKQIKNFKKVLDKAKELHSVVPTCKIIGWDLALDSDNEIVLIEGNAAHPGISVEQMCSGPIFGKRTDEVIDYVKTFNQLR